MSVSIFNTVSMKPLKMVCISLLIFITACKDYSDFPNVAETKQKSSVSIELYPATADIKINETKKFNAQVDGADDSAVKWSYEGCGWVEAGTGRYHAPKVITNSSKECIATLTATSLENPDVKAKVTVNVEQQDTPEEAKIENIQLLGAFQESVSNDAVQKDLIPLQSTNKSLVDVNETQAFTLGLSPARSTINVGTVLQLSAIVTEGSLQWSKIGCGNISSTGFFRAPIDLDAKKCTTTITAKSRLYPKVARRAIITILNPDYIEPLPVVEERSSPKKTSADTQLVVYPGIKQFTSNRFAVSVSKDGVIEQSFVYQSDNGANPHWNGAYDYMQDGNHWSTLSFSGSVNIDAKRLDGKTIKTCVVRPLKLKIQPVIQGSICSFLLDKPSKVSVEIDENYKVSRIAKNGGNITKHVIKNPLFIFADPLETDVPKVTDTDVLYFGPGIHRIGKQYKIANNTHVYLAGGAYVVGTFSSEKKNPKNISITGRGILSGIDLKETAHEKTHWGNHSIDFSNGHKGGGLVIEGITITDPLRSCIVSYNSVSISNIKLFSWGHRSDGITAGKKSVIQDSFIKVQDDNIKLYYGGQTVRHNVVWQQTAGAVFKFAWALSGVSEGHKVTDIDIIHSDVFEDYSGAEKDRPDMRSTSAIFSSMGFRKNSAFKKTIFKNIRIEEKYLFRLMGLRMVTTHQDAKNSKKNVYWGDPNSNTEKLIEGLKFENLSLAGIPYRQSTLYGNKGGKIRDIEFKNLKIKGALIDDVSLLSSKNDGPGLLTAGDVSGVTFGR